MERKSPARSARPGPSAMWACAIFSTMVCPISVLSHCGRAVSLKQLHQLRHARLLLQVPDGVHGAATSFARHHRLRQRLELLLHFCIGQRIPRIALGVVELGCKLAAIDGMDPDN